MQYKLGDVVTFKKRSSEFLPFGRRKYTYELCVYDGHLSGDIHVVRNSRGDIDFCHLEDLTPYIEENKQGKHYLTKFED